MSDRSIMVPLTISIADDNGDTRCRQEKGTRIWRLRPTRHFYCYGETHHLLNSVEPLRTIGSILLADGGRLHGGCSGQPRGSQRVPSMRST